MTRLILNCGWRRSAGGFVVALLMLMIAGPGISDPTVPRHSRPDDAHIYFITPGDAETLASPITVRFGLKGMGIAPAGVEKLGTGHHHLIIDAPLPDTTFAIPKDAKHRHFGGGQTQVTLELTPGTHTLQLLLGDFRHIPHSPPVSSKRITITVE